LPDALKVSKHIVYHPLKQQGRQSKTRRKDKATTNSKHNFPVAENLLKRQFSAEKPNQKWVSDITYNWAEEGGLYLAGILDLHYRSIVGWAMDSTMKTQLSDIKIEIFQDEENKKNLGQYVMEGAKIESGIHRINEESGKIFRANEYEKNKFRFGFSVEGQGMNGIKKYFIQGLLTLFPSMNNEKNSADLYVKSTQTGVDNTPAYGLIITNSNSRIEQVKSGMLYSRLVLQAHALGLVMHPPSQVLQEYPEMEEQYRKIHNDYAPNGGTIQMFFRIGKPTQEFPHSMRRDVVDLVDRN